MELLSDANPEASMFASTKALEFTYGLGLNENFGDKCEILTAIPKGEEQTLEIQNTLPENESDQKNEDIAKQ